MTICHTSSRGAAIFVEAVTRLICAAISVRRAVRLFPLAQRVLDG